MLSTIELRAKRLGNNLLHAGEARMVLVGWPCKAKGLNAFAANGAMWLLSMDGSGMLALHGNSCNMGASGADRICKMIAWAG